MLTTCARDYVTWKNEYPEGTDRVRGVTVRRFANAATRDIDSFNRYSDWIYNNPHSRADELEWLKQQGPWCPALIEHLKRHQGQYDVLVFFTYLYATTVLGLEVVPSRSVLVSTAHDEPAIRLDIFKDVFSKPAALCYLTESERRFVQDEFRDRPLLEEVAGVGIDIPQQSQYPADAGARRGAATGTTPRAHPRRMTMRRPVMSRPISSTRGVVFRRRHRLYGPVALYGGRIDPGKGCEELLEYFGAYVERRWRGDAGAHGRQADVAARGAVRPVRRPAVRPRTSGGPRSRHRGRSARRRTRACRCWRSRRWPSAHRCSRTRAAPCSSSTASGATAACTTRTRDEFVECLTLLVGDARLRAALGRNGRDYIRRNYRWDVVLGKYERLFTKIRNAR